MKRGRGSFDISVDKSYVLKLGLKIAKKKIINPKNGERETRTLRYKERFIF